MAEFVSEEQADAFEERLPGYWNRGYHYVDETGRDIPYWHRAGREVGIADQFITVIESKYTPDGKEAILLAETWVFRAGRQGRAPSRMARRRGSSPRGCQPVLGLAPPRRPGVVARSLAGLAGCRRRHLGLSERMW